MKNFKITTIAIISLIITTACSSDDNEVLPTPVIEEEVITTITVTLTPNDGTAAIVLTKQDLDGDGPGVPETSVSGNLAADMTYTGSIQLLNETESPAENITEEVEEESNEHQFFYTISDALNATTTYENFDNNDNPLGTELTVSTGAASSGAITFTLRHEPNKPNTGIDDAGGETDIEATFNVVIE